MNTIYVCLFLLFFTYKGTEDGIYNKGLKLMPLIMELSLKDLNSLDKNINCK